jgi:molecular chaperone GrpE
VTDQDKLEQAPALSAEELEAALKEARADAQRNLEGWQRERADFTNYKRRKEQEIKDSAQYSANEIFKTILPVLDDLERALSNQPSDLQGHAWVSGVVLVQKKFIKLLEENGVTQIDPHGLPFDPTRHEALGYDESDTIPSGHITVTLQRGYANGDKVLRSALVRVAK